MKKLIAIPFLSFLVLPLHTAFAQQVTQEWVARYNGSGNESDIANSVAFDVLGNVYVTGASYGTGTSFDYATIKYSAAGSQLWVQRYNGTGNGDDGANSIAIDGAGNVYVTGNSLGVGSLHDIITIKYSSSGSTEWTQRYNGPANFHDDAFAVKVDGSGNVYVAGESYGSGTGNDYVTIKYSSSGVQQWAARYNGTGNGDDDASSMALDLNGNVYVTGKSFGNGTDYDYATVKYSGSGTQLWVQRYNGTGSGEDAASSISADISGNVYVAGSSAGSGTNLDYLTIKYSSAGSQQWVQRYNGPGNTYDQAYSVVSDGSGNVFVTGRSVGSGTGFDFATIKYSSSGSQQWVQRFNGIGNNFDQANSLALDSSGNVYVTGISTGTSNSSDCTTLKYNSGGLNQWLARHNETGSGSDQTLSIAVDGSGNVYVTGSSTGNGTGSDYCTIKYSQTIGIQPVSSEIPKDYTLYQNFPNPFNPVTKIRFDNPPSPLSERGDRGGFVQLSVFDILGREVETLVNEHLKPGRYEFLWDGTEYSSGIYYYILTANEFSRTRKMVLLK